MSHRLRAAAVALMLSAIPASGVCAQLHTNLSLAAGASFPTGSFGDVYDTGYHLLVGVGLNPPLSPVGFRIDGMFNEFDVSGASSAKTRVLGLSGNLLVNASGGLGPYLAGGVGLYDTRPTGGGDRNDVGFNVGVGFRLGLAGFSAFAEARYHRVGDGVAQFIPVTFGVTF